MFDSDGYENADTNRPAGTAVTKPRARHGELASLLQPWESRERRFDSHEVAALKGERDGTSSNGTEDHVPGLIRFGRRFALMKGVQELKVETRKWLKRQPHDVSGGISRNLSPPWGEPGRTKCQG